MTETQLGDAALVDHRSVHEAAPYPVAGYESDPKGDDGWMKAACGMISAVLISAPFWALVAFAVYLLV